VTAVDAPATSSHEGFAYQPALDGVRAFAVLAVMLYHARVSWFPGGYLGVDAFFVLSGYLITSLMLVEMRRRGSVDRRAFWLRRARRLLPALFLVLLVVAAYAAFAATAAQVKSLRGDAFATLFYAANWRQVFLHHSYFDLFATPSMLQHTWSLAVEEQWYLIWPLLLPFLVHRTHAKPGRLLGAIVGLAAASAVLMAVLYHPGLDPSRVYYGTDTRAQSLLIGAGLAVLLLWRPGPRQAGSRVALQVGGLVSAGFLAYLWTGVRDTSHFLYTGGFVGEAFAVAVVIAAAVQPQRRLLRDVLSWAPLRWIGWISYGLYLWHWPVFVFLTPQRTGASGTLLVVERFAATFAIAIASYVLVEQPVRRGALRRRPKLGPILVPAAVVIVAASLVVGTSDLAGLGTRRAAAARTEDVATLTAAARAKRQAEQQAYADAHQAFTALVVGDSRADSLGVSYGPGVGIPNLAVQSVAEDGCGISVGQVLSETPFGSQDCSNWADRWRYGVELFHPQVSVMLIGTWDVFDRVVNGQEIKFGSPESIAYIDGELDRGLSILTEFGAPVIVLSTPCSNPPPTYFPWNDKLRLWNAIQRHWVDAHRSQVRLVDLDRYVCPLSKWATALNGAPLLPDGVHFSLASGQLMWRWLGPQVVRTATSFGTPTGTTPAPAK
jgi:peptidoglycan/LPS O-acetylase OafA/YrhL